MDGEEGASAGSRIIDAGDRDVARANRFADEDGGDEGAEKEPDGANQSFAAKSHGPLIPSFGVNNSKVGENNASWDGRQEGD